MPRPVAIIFDMDGLMLDSEPVYQCAWQTAAAQLGFRIEEALQASLIGRNQADSYRLLGEALGAAFPIEDFHRLWPEVWRSHVRDNGLEVKSGVGEMLRLTETFRLKRAVATSSDLENTELSLRATALWERFEVVVTGDQIARGKPHPDIYLEAARQLGVRPADCIALEDSEPGLMAAVNAGMRVIQIPDLTTPSLQAKQLSFACVESLDDAVHIINELLA